MRRTRLLLPLLLIAVLAALPFLKGTPASYAASGNWEAQTYNPNAPGIENNPLKGFVPFSFAGSSAFPHSLEFYYAPLRDIMTGPNSFTWTSLDNELAAIAGRGNQAVLRFYLDYPGRAIGTPQFLIDGGLQMRTYTDYGNTTSKSPNWNDANLMTALENFIGAFGARYNNDNRVGFVTIGLYGFWGEWHNYPHTDWDMSQSNKDRLISKFVAAFPNKEVLLRDPAGTTNTSLKHAVGYHDDSFAFETLGPDSWHFWPKMQANGLTANWQTHTTGGELRPEIQSTIFDTWNPTSSAGGAQNFQTAVATTHASWMMNLFPYENSLSGSEYANTLNAHKLMGYEYFVSSVKLPNLTSSSSALQVDVILQNKGVAGMAYNWPVELAVLDSGNGWVKSLGTVNWSLKSVLPGSDYQKTFSTSSHGLTNGSYKLIMRVVNPLSGGKQLKFANQKQDADRAGWLTLDAFTVGSSSDPSPVNLVQNPGFEAQNTGWNDWGNARAVSGQAKNGSYAMEVGTAAGGRGQQITSGFAPGNMLTLSAWGRAGSDQGWVGIKFFSSSGSVLSDNSLQFTSTSYTYKTLNVTVPSGAAKLEVYVWKNAGSSYFYADDISVVKN